MLLLYVVKNTKIKIYKNTKKYSDLNCCIICESKKKLRRKNTNILDILRLIDNVIISLNKNTKILKIVVIKFVFNK